jgi:hypothetical protein
VTTTTSLLNIRGISWKMAQVAQGPTKGIEPEEQVVGASYRREVERLHLSVIVRPLRRLRVLEQMGMLGMREVGAVAIALALGAYASKLYAVEQYSEPVRSSC